MLFQCDFIDIAMTSISFRSQSSTNYVTQRILFKILKQVQKDCTVNMAQHGQNNI